MEIRNIRHKGLRNLVEKNNTKGIQQDYVAKISDIMAFLIETEDIDEVMDLQKYQPHILSGDRAGTYSLRVTANWRITFKYDAEENELHDVDYEDYH
jgi:toxin HigB-1